MIYCKLFGDVVYIHVRCENSRMVLRNKMHRKILWKFWLVD